MHTKNLHKHATLIMLQLLLSATLLAQAPIPKEWDYRFGGADDDYFKDLSQTNDGGYILGGTTIGNISGDVTEAPRGIEDYWIVKTNPKGIKQWDKRFGGNSGDYLSSLRQTSDGGYILGGSSSSDKSGDKTQASWDNDPLGLVYDYWIVKTDANGVKQWDKRFGGIGNDELDFLQQTTDGGYILGGWTDSDISGNITQASRGDGDFWIVKIDANGTKQWDKRFGGSGSDYLRSLDQTTDGGYILGGWSNSPVSGDKTQASQGDFDYWIVKIDANGAQQWDKRFGGRARDLFQSLQQTTDGGYILGGYSISNTSGDKTDNKIGEADYWIVKTNVNGEKQWDKTFGGIKQETLYSVEQTIDGGYIFGGYTESPRGGDITEEGRGYYDYWVVKTNLNGVKQWDARFGGDKNNFSSIIKQTTDGNYILGGTSNSVLSYDKTQDRRGENDYWILKLGCPPSAKVAAVNGTNLCQTGSATLAADSSTGVKYQWLKNGVSIPNAINRTYTATQPGSYRVVVYTNRQCSQLSEMIGVINSCGEVANNLTISPNPSKGIVTVTYQSNSSSNVQLSIYDKTGKLMFNKTESAIKGNNTYQLDLSHLINGIYNLQLTSNSGQGQVKFIMEK